MSEIVVRDANCLVTTPVKDQLLEDISKMRKNNLMSEKEGIIGDLAQELSCLFIGLAEKYYQINKKQIKQLSSEKQVAFIELVHQLAYKQGLQIKLICCCIPIFGWIFFIGLSSKTVDYRNCVHSLKKLMGDSFDPVQTIKARL